MLFSNIVLLVNVSLERSKDITLFHDILSTLVLDIKKRLVGGAMFISQSLSFFWRYSKVFQFLAKHDDSLLGKEWIL